MRIIAGSLKGRKLLSPRNNDVRPTTDKVKEAVFSMLIPFLYEDCTVMDVFAGSGNMGLEAISRGAGKVYFSDASRESLALVRQNVSICKAEEKSVFLSGDFKANIRRVRSSVDIFILDPPYAAGFILPALAAIEDAQNISEGGVVVCEHAFRDKMPETIGHFQMIRDKKYGSIGVTLYQYTTAQTTENNE